MSVKSQLNQLTDGSFINKIVGIIFVLVICGFLFSLVNSLFLNRPDQTEARANSNLDHYIIKNKIHNQQRFGCAPDTDGDGYASCVIVTEKSEKIYLKCPASFWMHFTGATGCREFEYNMKINGPKFVK